MRYLKIPLTFLFCCFLVYPTNAQLPKASYYFPLQIGNVWQYDNTNEAEYLFFEVVGDSLIGDSVRVYQVKRSGLKGNDMQPFEGAPYYYHYNADSTVIYRDDFEFPPTPYSGLPIIDTRYGVGHVWRYPNGDYLAAYAIIDTGATIYYDKTRRWALVAEVKPDQDTIIVEPNDEKIRFVESIGPVRIGLDTLVYAKINGVEYGTPLGIDREKSSNIIPESTELLVYPNPSYHKLVIEVNVTKHYRFEIKIVNIMGQTIRTLHNGSRPSGHYRFFWDGKDNRGIAVSSGIYFALFQSSQVIKTRKIIFLAK